MTTGVESGVVSRAAHLFALLRAPDPGQRVGALRAVASDPERALAYGPHEGVGLQAELLRMADDPANAAYWRDTAAALARLRGPAVTAFFLRMLQTSDGPEQSFPAAERLALEERAPLLPALEQVLLDDVDLHRVAAVARILRDGTGVSVRARVRMAAADSGAPDVALTGQTLAAWLDELGGPYTEPARTRLETQGESAALCLTSHWARLPVGQWSWALTWIARAAPGGLDPLLVAVLDEPPGGEGGDTTGGVLAALDVLGRLGPEDPRRRSARPWQDSSDAQIRAAAAAAAPTPPDPGAVLALVRQTAGDATSDDAADDGGLDLVLALVRRLGDHPRALPVLATLVDDERWEIAVTAREALDAHRHRFR